MNHFRIERVIDGNTDSFIAKSTCRHCGESFRCDLRKVRLENLLDQHLATCPQIRRPASASALTQASASAPRPMARVLPFKKRAS